MGVTGRLPSIRLGRRAQGIEVSPINYDLSLRRLTTVEQSLAPDTCPEPDTRTQATPSDPFTEAFGVHE